MFNYEAFFAGEIDKKKSDHTYRVFKNVMRRGKEFPYAEDHSSGKKKEITVWCSNDYLGMSWHPKVINAVRLGQLSLLCWWEWEASVGDVTVI